MIMPAAVVFCLAVLAGPAASAAAAAPATAGRALLSGTWGKAQAVPGIASLNVGRRAAVNSVSCTSAGNCVAGGAYASGITGRTTPLNQAFVVTQSDGLWGTAEEVPGTADLNTGQSAQVASVSCPAPGECSAGGFYTDSAGNLQAFVVTEANGTWGTAEEVPGTASLNATRPGAEVTSVSCGAVGNCAAGGFYTEASGNRQAFVATEKNGTWGTAHVVRGTLGLNVGGFAQINSVSCASFGNCSAGGLYSSAVVDGVTTDQAFVVNETGGTWGKAVEVPGTAALNRGGFAQVSSVSCASAGNCSAGGSYTSNKPATQAFVVNESNGTWHTAKEVPGTGALNALGFAQVSSVSCPTAGRCSAAGFYQDASFRSQVFVVNETGGTWDSAQQVPGTGTLNVGTPGAVPNSLSCGAPGDCSAVGSYSDASNTQQAFVVSESGGTWGSAEEVPGITTFKNQTGGVTNSVSCPSAGNCTAGGSYATLKHAQSFVVSQTAP